jgi:hypothetical protein
MGEEGSGWSMRLSTLGGEYANEQRSRAFALWTRNRDTGEIEQEDSPGSWSVIVRENIEVPPGV